MDRRSFFATLFGGLFASLWPREPSRNMGLCKSPARKLPIVRATGKPILNCDMEQIERELRGRIERMAKAWTQGVNA